jgi:UDP-GlcNAc:undecaprenyl-phosphate/decaprenyl-phosphate GlcNAc-1-phosphate transferase
VTEEIGTYLAAFGAALVTALVVTPLARRAALRHGVLDHPGERKTQADPIPYLGGAAIVLAFVAAMTIGSLVHDLRGEYEKLALILGGGVILAGMGLWDDLRPIPGLVKAGTIVPLAVALYAADIRADPFEAWPLNFVVTIVWVTGIVNAINFLDNMDGVTAGVSAIAASTFAALAALSGQTVVGALSAAVAGCALGFLCYNRPPARIFMGDMGSHFLGWLLAVVALELEFENVRRVAFLVPIVVLGVPIFDTTLIVISRLQRRISPLRAGLDHSSHRLVRVGVPRTAVVTLHYLAAAVCGALGVAIAYARPISAYVVMGCVVAMGVVLIALLLQVRAED